MMPVRAGIALGSNLGNRLQNLQKARDQIGMIRGMHQPLLQSAVYETGPVNCEPSAEPFFNAVLEIGFAGSAISLWQALRLIEVGLGRTPESRTGGRNRRSVSRPIDLDLLYFGNETIKDSQLQLPHPRLIERRFVLLPLADINPDLQLPNQTATVNELLARLSPGDLARQVAEKW